MGGIPKLTDEERRKRKKSLAPAIAVSWDNATVKILCPFCQKTHNHDFSHFAYDRETGKRIQDDGGYYKYQGPSPIHNELRVPHCDHDPELQDISVSYTILFPFEEDLRVAGLSFEIDREKQRFRTLGLGVISPNRFEDPGSSDGCESPEEQSLRHDMHKMSLQEGDYDVVKNYEINGEEHQDTQRASVWIISFANTGDFKLLKQYLKDLPDRSSLLKIRSTEGQSLIGFAVPNGHLDIAQYLLDQGCDFDAADFKGRIPLMEAALWAHPKIVDALLKAGANKSLKDQYGMTAGKLDSMNNLAGVLGSRGSTEAERMHREELELSDEVLGREHPSTLDSMNNLDGGL